MSDVSQGPGWWQASDLKWYPPELHADYVAPLPPPPKLPPPPPPVTPTQSSLTTRGPSGQRKVGFVIAGLALLVIGVQIGWAILGHGLLPPLLVSAAIVIIGVTIAVRSGESQGRKLLFVIAMVLAFAVPAVLITVPVASMRFGGGSSGGAGRAP